MRLFAAWIMFGVLGFSSFAFAQEKKIKRSQLPPNVEKAVAALAENATIRGFSQEIRTRSNLLRSRADCGRPS